MKSIAIVTVDAEQYSEKENPEESILKIIKIFKKHNLKATFFVTGNLIENFPKIIELLKGHEIASHGMNHIILNNSNLEKEILGSKKFMESVGCEVLGFRAPQFTMPKEAFKVLERSGFLYDSSLIPSIRLGRYSNIFSRKEIHKIGNIWECPVSVLKFLRIPFSIEHMSLINYRLSKMMFKCLKPRHPLILYMHSYIADRFIPEKAKHRIYYRKRGRESLKILEDIISNFLADYKFVTMKQYLEGSNVP